MIPPIAPGQGEEKHNMVSWKNTFNMRQMNLMNLAASQLGIKNGSRSLMPSFGRNYSIPSPAKSLDLLRKNLQSAINKDIDNVIKKYIEKYFHPAINNIRNNLGNDSVGDDHIKEVCKTILEEAKMMYKLFPMSRDSSPYDYSDSEASTSDGRFGRMSPALSRKRKESETDSENGHKRHKMHSSVADYATYKLPIKRDGPKWNPDRITESTLFIMGARANKVLGYGQTRGRLYVRHPELLRYSGDHEDKEWLTAKNLMPPSGGKAYLMILDDIRELTESDEYKNNPNLQLHELKGFEAPIFLINKIKYFMQNVRTDIKPMIAMDVMFNLRSHSVTPPNVTFDSGPSTPGDTQLVDSHSTTSKQSESNFVIIPEMSPSSNNSIISSTMTQSPITNSGGILSPNMLMAIGTSEIVTNHTVVMKETSTNDNCVSTLLSNNISSNYTSHIGDI